MIQSPPRQLWLIGSAKTHSKLVVLGASKTADPVPVLIFASLSLASNLVYYF